MNESSRIEVLSSVETVPRQTQNRDFGTLVASSLSSVVTQGVSLVRGAIASVPMLSAAVSGIQSAAGIVSASGSAPVAAIPAVQGLGSTSTLGIGGLSGSGMAGMPSVQSAMQHLQSGDSTPGDYLVVQQAMQQESQQYQTLTNILKVRSDSAKAAINNIR